MYFSLRHEPPLWITMGYDGGARRRRSRLKFLDRELSKGNFKSAISLVKQLQGTPGGLRGFGAAKQRIIVQVSQRISSLNELNLSVEEVSSLQSLIDYILESIKINIQAALLEEVLLSGLETSTCVDNYDSHLEDHLMCMQHEAGHFLVGYLLGVLPKKYRVDSMEAEKQERLAGGSVQFFGFEFLREVDILKQSKNNLHDKKLYHVANRRKMSSKALNRFLCVMVGGLVAEHLVFGYSKGLHSDVEKLDRVFKWLGFTEQESDSHLRWAILNTVLILSRHREARSKLAEAMALGRSVGFCIDTIENALNNNDI